MSTILQHLSRLIDLPPTNPDLIFAEVRNKLVGTYIIVNGELYHLTRYEKSFLELCSKDDTFRISGAEVNDISFFLPDSGAYRIEGNYYYLEKIAKRQWKKSFSWSYYRLVGRDQVRDVFDIYRQIPVNIYIQAGVVMFYNDLPIARFVEKKWELSVPSFQYEFDKFIKENPNAI